MNRNTNLLMGSIPQIHSQRSRIDRSKSLITTFKPGLCIPIYTDTDIMPGDTVEMDLHSLVRLATPIAPVADNLICDIYAFFVPHRLVWEHWEEFWGQNDDPWIQTTQYTVPKITAPSGGWAGGTLADYFTWPTLIDGLWVNCFAPRAYAKIWSDWFRDENLKPAAHMYTDDTNRTGSNGSTYVTDVELAGMPAPAAKTADMFTKALPTPQKGPAVKIPLGTAAKVYTGEEHSILRPGETSPMPLIYKRWDAVNQIQAMFDTDKRYALTVQSEDNPTPAETRPTAKLGFDEVSSKVSNARELYPTNLITDLRYATASTINELRTAFAIQKYYEAAARYGTRYIEYLRAVFGVESSDARMQRAEYLGGCRIPVNMSSIVQTSATDSVTPQGNASGYSCTISSDSLFTKSFEEHGTLMMIAVIRVDKRSYQQGLHKMFSRLTWEEFYNPFFANLGEQEITNRQIYAQGDSVLDSDGNIIDDQVFGYQEAWAEYRYAHNDVTGDMRSNAIAGSLDFYHYADEYSALPTLGSTWIDEPTGPIDRTIAVASETAHPIIGSFYFNCKYTRVMPLYSLPGLIDHV